MDPLDRAALLHQEADFVMHAIRFHEIMAPYGPLTFTGSYYLDLMAFPDIDVEVPTMTPMQIFTILAQLFASPLVNQVEFEKPNDPRLPDGLYFKPRIDYGNWGRPWKIDIWSLTPAEIAAGAMEMAGLKSLITPETRQVILNYKVARLNAQNRTPKGSGWWIYQAVLVEGIKEAGEIDAYLFSKGITV